MCSADGRMLVLSPRCCARCAEPCRVMPCHAVLHCALPCCAMPCHALPCRAMLCHAVPCFPMLCHALPCCAVPCLATSPHWHQAGPAGAPGAQQVPERLAWSCPRVPGERGASWGIYSLESTGRGGWRLPLTLPCPPQPAELPLSHQPCAHPQRGGARGVPALRTAPLLRHGGTSAPHHCSAVVPQCPA